MLKYFKLIYFKGEGFVIYYFEGEKELDMEALWLTKKGNTNRFASRLQLTTHGLDLQHKILA